MLGNDLCRVCDAISAPFTQQSVDFMNVYYIIKTFFNQLGLRFKFRLSGGWREFRQSYGDGDRDYEQLRKQTHSATALHPSTSHYSEL